MELLCENFKVVLNDFTGIPTELLYVDDTYEMNWIRGDYPWGMVNGFDLQQVEKTENGFCIFELNKEKKLGLYVKRYTENGRYCEAYTFKNLSDSEPVILDDSVGIVFPYNNLFDKKENMLHTRCNSHIWCAERICNIHSVKLDGQKPYLIQEAVAGSFSGYGLLCDICASPNASHDRGNIVLYPQKTVLNCSEEITLAFEFHFSEKREPISCVYADRYSGFVGDAFSVSVQWFEKIEHLFAEYDGVPIAFCVDNDKAVANITFDSIGEKTVNFIINGENTFIRFNVLDSIENILERRVNFIVEKQQYVGEDQRLKGAYLIYDRESDSQYYNPSFADHNCARERLSMGTLVAASLSRKYDPAIFNDGGGA